MCGYIKFIKVREQILKEYAIELIDKIKSITGLTMPIEIHGEIWLDGLVRYLEDFVVLNNLFDIKEILKKYELRYLRVWKEFAQSLPASKVRDEVVERTNKMIEKSIRR